MATITKRGDTYRIRVFNGTDINGKQLFVSTTFTPDPDKTKKENKDALNLFALQYEQMVKSGKLLRGDKLRYKDFAQMWLDDYVKRHYKDTTITFTEKYLDSIVKGLGNLKMTEITPYHIQKYLDGLADKGYIKGKEHRSYSNGTLKRIYNIISSSLTQAVYWQIIDNNPCWRVKPPKVEIATDKSEFFDFEEAKRFLEFLDEPYLTPHGANSDCVDEKTVPLQFKTIFYLALFCGFRRGEILALEWNDIDFDKGTITISRSLSSFDSGIAKISTPKSKKSVRSVYVPDCCLSMLHQIRSEQLQNRLLMGSDWRGQGNVFSRKDGYYLHKDSPYQRFKDVLKRYNESHEDKLPDIRFHGLRHTMATLMIAQGEDIGTISARLGHKDKSTTLNIYTHAIESRDKEASNNLAKALAM